MSYQSKLPPFPRYLRRQDRRAIEAQIEALIELLDQEDGDCDLEEDDPSGDPSEQEEAVEYKREMPLPIYGIDQTNGPINEIAAYREYRRRMGWGDLI